MLDFFTKVAIWALLTTVVLGVLGYLAFASAEAALVVACAAISILIWHLVSANFERAKRDQ